MNDWVLAWENKTMSVWRNMVDGGRHAEGEEWQFMLVKQTTCWSFWNSNIAGFFHKNGFGAGKLSYVFTGEILGGKSMSQGYMAREFRK